MTTEKAMAPHSSTLAWKIPWMEKPGRLQSMGSQRVRHDWATSLWCVGEGNGNPLQCSCLENPRDAGAWWAAVYGVAQSRTRLKWLSSSSEWLMERWMTGSSLNVFLKGKIDAETWNEKTHTLWTKTKPNWNIVDKVYPKSFPTISATDIF